MKEREDLHLKTDKGGIIITYLINFPQQERKKAQFRSLYIASMVIETKVVIG